ncbi:MAG: thioredoxin domain-containing protein [Planctomycetaceae bacterium]|nr:thioredoxin domain-containing protein [Planctomycetaceae bacterium]
MTRFSATLLAALVCGIFSSPARTQEAADPKIVWEEWSDRIFERSQREHKLVLLHLGAVWCHWCHVMEKMTYQDADVARLVRKHFIAIHVDQDARPDLSNRYEEYGWPATIMFDEKGTEIVKRRGYIPPGPFTKLLEAVVADPTPGPSAQPRSEPVYASAARMSDELRARLLERWEGGYDAELGGWGKIQKYLDSDCIELAMKRGRQAWAERTLAAHLKLIDPVWGGAYQYSHGGVWENPHYEKIMPFQADAIHAHVLNYLKTGSRESLDAAKAVRRYLDGLLRNADGIYYVSQDADLVKGDHAAEYFALDDAGRRKLGMPRIDTHLYARENGLAIRALAELAAASDDADALKSALRVADWVLANRSLPEGGFRHDQKDAAGPYLADTLAMGRAFLGLYMATADRVWLERSVAAARFIDRTFAAKEGPGYLTVRPSGPLPAVRQIDENTALVRWTTLLRAAAKDDSFRAMGERAMKFLATPDVALTRGMMTAGLLLAEAESSSEPLKITVVGKRWDPATEALLREGRRTADPFLLVELQDESASARDGAYPMKERPSAYVCTAEACKGPLFAAAEIRTAAARLTGR